MREDKYVNENGNASRIDRCDWLRVCWGGAAQFNWGYKLIRRKLRYLCDFMQVVIDT